MEELFKHFGSYIRTAEFDTLNFWLFPIGTVIIIWVLTMVSIKLINKKKKGVKTVFRIHKHWICCSIIIATVIIGLTCYWWATNYFNNHPLQLSMLISLFIALLFPIISFSKLRSFFTAEDIREITDQAKTPSQFDETLTFAKKEYRKKRLCYLILLAGFLFLLFSLNNGKNLISIVFDNSESMDGRNAIEALSETFDNLGNNNEIVLTTLEGLDADTTRYILDVDKIFATKKASDLKAGNVQFFTDPIAAKNGLNITNNCWGSPICESIWKSFLLTKESKTAESYSNKLLIVITDGIDNAYGSLSKSRFFFDQSEFAEFYNPENVFIIDYSDETLIGQLTGENLFMNKFQESGCEVYNVVNSKDDYINALNAALNSFVSNWFLIFWVIIISAIMTLIAMLIGPKKIV